MVRKKFFYQAPYIFLLLFWGYGINAQTQHLPATEHLSNQTHGMKGSHRLSLGLGHAHLSQGRIEGRTSWVPVASWSLNYDYWLSNKWAIGLQNDLILETFVIEHGNNQQLERNKPLVMVPVGILKFSPHWSVLGGVGAEFSEGHTLKLTVLAWNMAGICPKTGKQG